MNESAQRRVAEARDEIRQVCDWLSRPSAETMAACAPALERAVARIDELSTDPAPGLIDDLRALAAEIQIAQALLSRAGELYFGRMRRLAVTDLDTSPTPAPICVTG